MCPLRGYDVNWDVTESFSKYMSLFFKDLRDSYFFCECMMCLTFSYELSNELAFNYVVMTSLVASQSRFLNILHDCRKISCLLSSFMSQKVCSATRARTHTKTDTKVDTGDTLSGFQEFLIQLIIKDQSNKKKQWTKKRMSDGTRTLNLHRGTLW